MSNATNDKLMETVRELMEYWTGTMHERIMQRDLDANDLEALHYHAKQAHDEMMLQETELELNDVY